MSNNKRGLKDVLDHCEQSDFGVNEMIDELHAAASNPAHTGQWHADRADIVAHLSTILSKTGEIHGTVETAGAITEYHRSVVAPLVSNLVHALIECRVQLEDHKEAKGPRRAA